MKSKHLVLLALLGLYVNIIAFGFKHDLELLPFQFALINWFRDPSLYAGDPITAAFARYPTFFWLAVAHASAWIDTPRLLFLVFILTKVLFFFALVRLVAKFLK